MAVYNYSKYKIRIDSDSQKTQGLQVGDVVRRQYTERNQSIYSLMVVVETGIDAIDGKESPYFIGALLDGDEPKSGELLDFVRITSLTNTDRSGAMYLTASDSDAPYMDIIDGMATERSLCYPTMAGNTQNVFQFSSPGITRFIQDVQPNCIEDLIAINALFRPATLDIGATDDYVRYRRGDVAPVYNFGCYEATKNTYGIMVYQEQFMSVAHTLGGFDLGKTDYLRKAIGKKKADLMASLKNDFIAGAIKNGCPPYEAEEIWGKIETAGKYSFNRSHAAAYALTAFCGAWLKANYPTAFYTVALQWADDKEMPALMSEMERCSVAKIVPPDINHSTVEFFTDYKANEIYWSLNRIKFLGTKAAAYIVTVRSRGRFTSIEDFIERVFRHKLRSKDFKHWDEVNPMVENGRVPVNTRHLKNMILAGCFDKIENVQAVTERYAILKRAALKLGFNLRESDAPEELRDKHYFWSQQQIAVSGIGSIDYRRIFSNSPDRAKVKGKAAYIPLADVMRDENDGRKAAVCATVAEYSEHSYTDRETGQRKRFVKLMLSQNNQSAECTLWDEFYRAHKEELQHIKGKIIILTAVIRYSDYTASNALQSYRNSLLFIQ